MIPGLVDTHIHAPQYPNAGLGYDETLLDWLQKYTFPLESKYNDIQFAAKVYDAIVVSFKEKFISDYKVEFQAENFGLRNDDSLLFWLFV